MFRPGVDGINCIKFDESCVICFPLVTGHSACFRSSACGASDQTPQVNCNYISTANEVGLRCSSKADCPPSQQGLLADL